MKAKYVLTVYVIIAICILYWMTIMNIRHSFMQTANSYIDSAIESKTRQLIYITNKEDTKLIFEEQNSDRYEILAKINYDKADNILNWIPKFTRPQQ